MENERLYYAIQVDDSGCLKRLIEEGLDVDTVFSGGVCATGRPARWSALHLCCEKGSYECAKLLLEAGADPDPEDKWSITPLMYCIQAEWREILQLLIASGAKVSAKDRKGRSVTHFAIECTDTSILQTLIDSGADPDIGDFLARTPLWLAVTKDGQIDFVRVLMASGRCSLTQQDVREGRTPLQAAITHSKDDYITYANLLLGAGSDVNIRDTRNHTALMNLIVKSWNDLSDVRPADLELFKHILEADYRINDVPEKKNWIQYGGPVLNMAVERGAPLLVETLLAYGADPDITDGDGVGSLLLAASLNRVAIAAHLILANCEVNRTGNLRLSRTESVPLTPVQCAVMKGHWQLTSLLVEAGCDVTCLTYLWTNDNVPNAVVENCDFWLWLKASIAEVKPLAVLARDRVRKLLGKDIKDKTTDMNVPEYIKQCILMTFVLQPYLSPTDACAK